MSPLSDFDRICLHGDGPNHWHHLYALYHLQREAASAGIRVVLHGFAGDTVMPSGNRYARELAVSGRWGKLAALTLPYVRTQGLRSAIASYWSWVNPYLVRPAFRRMSTRVPWARSGRTSKSGQERATPLWRFVVNPAFEDRIRDQLVRPAAIPQTETEAHRARFVDRYLLEGIDWGAHLSTVAGVEWRSPFLDERVVEFCVSIPPEMKVRRGWTRYPLRRAMKGILPEEIRWRTSKSNVYPGWRFALRAHGRKEIEHLTGSPSLAAMEFLDFSRVRDLAARFLDGKATLREEPSFWRALTLERWLSGKKV